MKSLIFTLIVVLSQVVYGQDVAQHLQDVSVTIKSASSEGSGVLITRSIKPKQDSK